MELSGIPIENNGKEKIYIYQLVTESLDKSNFLFSLQTYFYISLAVFNIEIRWDYVFNFFMP